MIDKIAILGFGKTALSAIKFILLRGIENVTVLEANDKEHLSVNKQAVDFYEQLGVKFHFQVSSEDYDSILNDYETVLISPGFKPNSPIVQYLKRTGKHILTDLTLFTAFLLIEAHNRQKPLPYIGVTGTNGKTTTCSLIAHLLDSTAYGNIGLPMLEYFDSEMNKPAVLELSSFQLYYTKPIYLAKDLPNSAVYLNLDEDHLDWHQDFNDYRSAKEKLFMLSETKENKLVFNFDSEPVKNFFLELLKLKLAEQQAGKNIKTKISIFTCKPCSPEDLAEINKINDVSELAILSGEQIIIYKRVHDSLQELYHYELKDLKLKGLHNYANIMAALLAITDLEQFDFIKSVRDMQNFTSVEHRLEYVCDVNGKVFYNDSKATNPVSAIKSLEAFEQSIAIVGGKNKGLDLAEFLQIASQKCAHIIAIGELQQPIYDYLKNSLNYETVETAATLAQAVELANAKSESLPVVLAPASSSFDMFNSYEDRGKQFKELVGKL